MNKKKYVQNSNYVYILLLFPCVSQPLVLVLTNPIKNGTVRGMNRSVKGVCFLFASFFYLFTIDDTFISLFTKGDSFIYSPLLISFSNVQVCQF